MFSTSTLFLPFQYQNNPLETNKKKVIAPIYSTAHYSALQCSLVQCSTIQYSTGVETKSFLHVDRWGGGEWGTKQGWHEKTQPKKNTKMFLIIALFTLL